MFLPSSSSFVLNRNSFSNKLYNRYNYCDITYTTLLFHYFTTRVHFAHIFVYNYYHPAPAFPCNYIKLTSRKDFPTTILHTLLFLHVNYRSKCMLSIKYIIIYIINLSLVMLSTDSRYEQTNLYL